MGKQCLLLGFDFLEHANPLSVQFDDVKRVDQPLFIKSLWDFQHHIIHFAAIELSVIVASV
jgi:hypothetical protein